MAGFRESGGGLQAWLGWLWGGWWGTRLMFAPRVTGCPSRKIKCNTLASVIQLKTAPNNSSHTTASVPCVEMFVRLSRRADPSNAPGPF